jgi:hypothetical protein
VCFDPIEPSGDPRDESAVVTIVRQTAAIIERVVSDHPDQWYCFYPFWDDPARRKAPPGRTADDQASGPADEQSGRVAPTAAT